MEQLYNAPHSLVLREVLWLHAPRVLSDFDQILMSFWPFENPFLDWWLKVFWCLDLAKAGVYGKHTLSTFQQNWPCAILTFVQKTTAPRSRAVEMFSAFKMVFPCFSTRIPISSDNLLTNQKNLIVDEVSLFKKVQTFQKLMIRIGKMLCTEVVCPIVVVGNFPALRLIFVVFPKFGWPSSWCWIWENLVFMESLCCLLTHGTNLVSFWVPITKLQASK